MARPTKDGIEYFYLECDPEDKLNYIEARYELTGWAVVIKIWRKIYRFHGYWCEWDEKSQYIFAKENNIKIEFLQQVVNTCFDEQLFSKELHDKYKILTSSGVQKFWKKVAVHAKRKTQHINPKMNLIKSIPAGNKSIPAENPRIPTETPEEVHKVEVEVVREYDKVRVPTVLNQYDVVRNDLTNVKSPESIPEGEKPERKTGKKADAGKPRKPRAAKRDPNAEPYWKELVSVYYSFYHDKFKTKPDFEGSECSHMKRIIQALKKRTLADEKSWDLVGATVEWRRFLHAAYDKKFFADNFLLSIIGPKKGLVFIVMYGEPPTPEMTAGTIVNVKDELFNQTLEAYKEFYTKRTSVLPLVSEKDEEALFVLNEHLYSISTSPINTAKELVVKECWRIIFENWDKLHASIKDRLSLKDILYNINTIIPQIKNKDNGHAASKNGFHERREAEYNTTFADIYNRLDPRLDKIGKSGS